MRIESIFASLALLALASGCATSTSVRVLADPDADLSAYRTFAFFDPLGTDRAEYQSIVSEQLKRATTREMQARGYTYSDEDPDLLINFSASLEDKLRVTQTPTMSVGVGMGMGSAWGGGYYGYRSGLYSEFPVYQSDVREYQEGTLHIDVVDARGKRLLWEGIGVRSVSRKTLANIGPAIDEAVTEIFRKYPAQVE